MTTLLQELQTGHPYLEGDPIPTQVNRGQMQAFILRFNPPSGVRLLTLAELEDGTWVCHQNNQAPVRRWMTPDGALTAYERELGV